MNPQRIQLSRRAGFNLQDASMKLNGLPAKNCARPSRYGNPHHIGMCPVCGVTHTRKEAVAEFEAELMQNLWATKSLLEPLKGHNLACWCHASENCHCDILLKILK